MRALTNIRQRGRNWYGRWRDPQGRIREKCLGPRLDIAREMLGEITRNARRWKPSYAGAVKSALDENLKGIDTVGQLTAGAIALAEGTVLDVVVVGGDDVGDHTAEERAERDEAILKGWKSGHSARTSRPGP